jgi:hypothetical protein
VLSKVVSKGLAENSVVQGMTTKVLCWTKEVERLPMAY